jgi:hypothetical protein
MTAGVVAAAVLAVAVRADSSTPTVGPPLFRTAVYTGPVYLGPDTDETGSEAAFANVARSGATFVRLSLYWPAVVPESPRGGFAGDDPNDPEYRWDAFDELVRRAAAKKLTPIVTIWGTPKWASNGTSAPPAGENLGPQPAALKAFATAAARRYSGDPGALPRVRYWMAWNEANFGYYLSPVLENGKPASPRLYREMLNAFADGVHSVKAGNLVIAGGLEPFTQTEPRAIGPLRFMRELLCLPANESGCTAKAKFDIWSTHPYTSGGPSHAAYNPDDVSLGDLPEVRALLKRAWQLRRIDAPAAPQFWVTEFSWDTNPPDPHGVPMRLELRWIAEAMYRMWASGVNLVTWLQLHDDPRKEDDIQSGLYFNGPGGIANDRPKAILNAFRFPFVAFRGKGRTTYWGRTPDSRSALVRIELKVGTSPWRRIAAARANRHGIFTGVARLTAKTGYVRARIGSDLSPSFSLVVPQDRSVTPFGVGPTR